MKFNWIRRAAELERAGTPFAIATVIDTIASERAYFVNQLMIDHERSVDKKYEDEVEFFSNYLKKYNLEPIIQEYIPNLIIK